MNVISLGGLILTALILSVIPSTGWIMRLQADLAWSPNTLKHARPFDTSLTPRQIDAVLHEHPNDPDIQIASVLMSNDGFGPFTQQLMNLEPKYPNDPVLYAQILKTACQRTIEPDYHMDSFWRLNGPPPSGKRKKILLQLLKIAHRGAKIDPNNAYWFIMMTGIDFSLHDYSEGVNALLISSNKPKWNLYEGAVTNGIRRIFQFTYGEMSASEILTENFYARLSSPGAVERGITDVGIYYVTHHLEKQNKLLQGVAIRHAILHLGGLIRADSHSILNELVESAISKIALVNPGGKLPSYLSNIPLKHHPVRISSRMLLANYIAYLKQHGWANEAKWVKREYNANESTLSILKPVIQKDTLWNGEQSLALYWVAGVRLLKTVILLILLMIIGTALSMFKRIRQGSSFHSMTRRGALFGLIVLTVSFFGIACVAHISMLPAIEIAGLILACALWWVWRNYKGRERRDFTIWLRSFLISLPVYAVVGVVISYLMTWWLMLNSGDIIASLIDKPSIIFIVSMCILLIIMAMWIIGICIVSWRRKLPVSVGLVKGFQRTAIILAFVVMMAYGALIFKTVRVERTMSVSFNECNQNACLYYEKQAGESWSHIP